HGTVPAATIAVPTGSAPAAIGSTAIQPRRSVLTRRAEVTAATAIISVMNAAVAHHERSTAVITTHTAPSCRIARSEAVTIARRSPSCPAQVTTAATTINKTRTAASTGPVVTAP